LPPASSALFPYTTLFRSCLVVGMLPAWTVAPLLSSAASASLGGVLPEYSLMVWHGLNLPLLISTLALLGGILVYAARKPLYRWRSEEHTSELQSRENLVC